jgi:hypothetical protein
MDFGEINEQDWSRDEEGGNEGVPGSLADC